MPTVPSRSEVYLEALEIRKRLVLDNPQRYEPDVAMTQNNLGAMYYNLNAYGKVKQYLFGSARNQISGWYWDNPQRYEPDVATTQNNLGIMCIET
ncbi:MAG: tetratricopeptide repeat protein [Lewinellaceae bacterium]|nr:tetratricopeptide repeat protein [Lewinellaceae bacterium]